MSHVQSLGYIGCEVSDLAAWRGFATDFVGLQWGGTDATGLQHLRVDARASRIQLSQGPRDDVAWLGWEVAGPEALEALRADLVARGVVVSHGSAAETVTRKVEAFVHFEDPDGIRQEAFYGAERDARSGFAPGRPIAGFETEAGGLGHVILNVRDVAIARSFYEHVLGFRLTDIIAFSPFPGFTVHLTFLRCNARHHTIALASFPFAKKLQHLMLQYASLDDVGRAWDMALRDAMPITLTLGRHSNDEMLSFYVRTPSGFEVELGWGAIEVDNDAAWSVQLHRHQSIWGHHPGPALMPPPGIATLGNLA